MVTQFELGSARNFVYLVADPHTRRCAIIDPWKDLEPVLETMASQQLTLTHVLLTHSHWDHVGGVESLARNHPSLQVCIHAHDLPGIDGKCTPSQVRLIHDGDRLEVGALRIEVMHTPGHSPGECSYLLPGTPASVFTGDTLFIEDCGRTDLPGGDNAQMLRSLHRLRSLPPDTVVWPGHHYRPATQSTIARERAHNPALRCESVADLQALP